MLSVARPSIRPFLFSLFIFLASAGSIFGQCGSLGANSTSWTDLAATQNFSTAGNWSNGAPTNALNTCIVNGTAGAPTTVSLTPGVNGSVLSLEVDANNTLNIGSGSDLFVSGPQIINGGAINFTAGAGNSVFQLEASTTLSGGGVLTLATTGAGTALITGASAGLTLTNQGAIEGAGAIGGSAGFTVINQGTILANVSGQNLTIGGEVVDTTVNNSGGNMTGNSGGTIVLGAVDQFLEGTNTTVQGGTLNGTLATSAAGDAVVVLDGSTHGALTIASGAVYTNGNNSYLYTLGSIVNNGTINITSAGNNSILGLNGNTTLSGTGVLNLSTTVGGAALIVQNSGGLTLTNQSTIAGYGSIGNGGGLAVNNQGTINANVSGQTLTLNGTGGVANTALLEATNGGTLLISGATVNNSGGNITGNGGTVELGGNGIIQGGTLNGTLSTIAGATGTLDGTTSGPITISAGSTYTDSGTLLTKGTITNNGNINVTAATLELSTNTTLNGTGTVTLSGGTITGAAGGLTLTNGANSTIQGAGTIGGSANFTVMNQGTILANVSGQNLAIGGEVVDTTVNNLGGNITGNGGGTVT
ncbi:MAG TPA: hypothetical protein VIY49_40250, partial [Bryobacteraceae bacterium]